MPLYRILVPLFCLAPSFGCTVLAGSLAALQPYYSAGDLAHDHADRSHATATVGCVDLALDLTPDDHRTVLEWRMGNRCNGPVKTDLSRVAVVQQHADGSRVELAFDDPKEEIGPRDLAPRREALERIVLRGADPESGSVCIDASGVADRAGAPPASPMCFAWKGHWIAGGSS